jgi:hypothetical protein
MGTAGINIAKSARPINGANVCIKALHLIASSLLPSESVEKAKFEKALLPIIFGRTPESQSSLLTANRIYLLPPKGKRMLDRNYVDYRYLA